MTTSCKHDPKETTGPIGMYHCPDCMIMVVAGTDHPNDNSCKEVCSDWQPPDYIAVDSGPTKKGD